MINLLMLLGLISQCYGGNCGVYCPQRHIQYYYQSSNTVADVVLYKYSGNAPDERVWNNANQRHNISRSICYPDSHCIIMIPKTEYSRVKSALGNTMLLVSPELR